MVIDVFKLNYMYCVVVIIKIVVYISSVIVWIWKFFFFCVEKYYFVYGIVLLFVEYDCVIIDLYYDKWKRKERILLEMYWVRLVMNIFIIWNWCRIVWVV